MKKRDVRLLKAYQKRELAHSLWQFRKSFENLLEEKFPSEGHGIECPFHDDLWVGLSDKIWEILDRYDLGDDFMYFVDLEDEKEEG